MKTTNLPNNGMTRTLALIGATVIVTLVVAFAVLIATGALTLPNRQAEVATRGAQVMPFDLEKTQHIFTQQSDGGMQQIVARDPGDTTQITLIRQHLHEEADKFQRGDFADPASIHGSSMPGLADLRNSAGKITVNYSELPNGAQIQYTTGDQNLVMALHHWFTAQTSDHAH